MSRHKFGIQFSIAARLWRRHLDQRLAQAGIKDISWAPLLHLDEFGDGISQKELAASVGMEGSTLVRLLDTLEQKGQIERQADTYDRRAKRIFLTAAGREHVVSLRAELLAIETDMLADVSDEQIEVMRQVLGGLITKFKH